MNLQAMGLGCPMLQHCVAGCPGGREAARARQLTCLRSWQPAGPLSRTLASDPHLHAQSMLTEVAHFCGLHGNCHEDGSMMGSES